MPHNERSTADPELWQVVHASPGRVRFRSRVLRQDDRLASGIRLALHKLPGVRLVRATAVSGSVLILYDESQQSVESLTSELCHCHRSHGHRATTLEAREVEVVHSIVQVLAATDVWLRSRTNGVVTLRKLALGLITGKAALQISEAGFTSSEAIGGSLEVFLSWILFRHRRLEREVEKLESYIGSGI